MSYNGWSNYETWAVGLWMDNEPGTHYARMEALQSAWDDAGDHRVFSKSEEARYNLAEWLKDFVEEGAPTLGASLYSDLLGAAISEVDWQEIADNWLTEVEGYEARDHVPTA